MHFTLLLRELYHCIGWGKALCLSLQFVLCILLALWLACPGYFFLGVPNYAEKQNKHVNALISTHINNQDYYIISYNYSYTIGNSIQLPFK